MKKNLFPLTCILLLFAACKQHKPQPFNKAYVKSDEGEITTLAFNYVMPSDSVFKITLPKYTFPSTENEKIQTLKNELDTAKLYVFIADSLVRLPADYLKQQTKNHATDPVKQLVLDSWASEIIISEKAGLFQLKNLAFTYNYVYTLRGRRSLLPKDIISAGLFRMSPVFFNSDKTKAFVYIERRGGTIVAQAFDMFLEKKKDKWFVVLCSRNWAS
ncbi:hypothetical protein [Mucilaginibacter sp. FT3.2]|uniref:hypothetical protein n=1 Tax=Mucilaginibacter sp. FT3.2 TaxID=2723090 RepID=UPI00160BB8CD|nr:hypothetical protein [Mucilaginibacter sp. FT3.2]MBB6233223.1 hypothetical protein [Mucilaginibacter sp. FT3.2]